MARKPCVEFPGAFFHVSARSNHRQGIFHDDTDRAAYKEVGQQLQRDLSVVSRLYASYAAHRDEERETRLSQAIRMREQKVNMQACPLFCVFTAIGAAET